MVEKVKKMKKAVDLTKILKSYTSGWVAIHEKTNKVIAHTKDFHSIAEKVRGKKDILLIPASPTYFGFI